ncbi:MAG: hypothetical protein JSW61_13820 [Candidatus Thorarchaeota archaeon]|nr:MAG: hypothetical protein JSW61_13820 [Candidatus Thorarchaeota archaeon]
MMKNDIGDVESLRSQSESQGRIMFGHSTEELEKRARIFRETVISAVLLGVALNLLANAIWALVSATDNILLSSFVALLAVSLIIILVSVIGYSQYSDMRESTIRLKLVMIWDGRSGGVIHIPYLISYPPQTRLLSLLSKPIMDPVVEPVRELLMTDLEAIRASNSQLGKFLFEIAFFQNLGLWIGVHGTHTAERRLIDIIGDDNPLLPAFHLADTALHCPGDYDTHYDRERGQFELRWKEHEHGRLNIHYRVFYSRVHARRLDIEGHDLVLLDGMLCKPTLLDANLEGMIQANCIVQITSRFNPVMLLLNFRKARSLYRWASLLMMRVADRFDWERRTERAYRTISSRT